MTTATEATPWKPSFSGHESFPMRYSWLKKGYDLLLDDEGAFSRDDAMVHLGTGKNMVASIRHWGLACGVWEDAEGSRGGRYVPTEFGHRLLADDGWDPYLEDIGTIWWLHHQIVVNPVKATTWGLVFGRPRFNRFRRDDLVTSLVNVVRDAEVRRVPLGTLKRDVGVFVSSYVAPGLKKGTIPEDSLNSPFTQLGLMRAGAERATQELVEHDHPTLPRGIFEAAISSYFYEECGGMAPTLEIQELLYSENSPGRVFRLTEDAFVDRLLKHVTASRGGLVFNETAGLRQLIIHREPLPVLDQLEHYYSQQGGR